MGRKIPGKKHRTVKDPEKQRQARVDSLKNKINNPPQNVEEQEIPRSLLNIMAFKTQSKSKTFSKPQKSMRIKRKDVLLSVAQVLDEYPNSKPIGYIPNIVQMPNESPYNFLRRLKCMTDNLIEENQFERKFGVEIKRDEETGRVTEVKRVKKKRQSKKKTLVQKRKERELKRKEYLNNVKDFNQFKDIVKFGEVAHRPPNLTLLKKGNANFIQTIKNPTFNNLLMNKIIKKESPTKSLLEKEHIESERKFIVEAYRRAKSKIKKN